MPNDYSGNPVLEKFSKKLNFKLKIFDVGNGTKLANTSTDCDIDAILYCDNVVMLLEVYGGKNKEQAKDKLEKQQIGFKNLDSFIDLKSNLQVNAPNETMQKQENSAFKKIIRYLEHKQNSSFNVYVKKLFYCPHIEIDREIKEASHKKGIFVFDREISHYLDQVYNTLGQKYLFRDLIDFLDISKVNLSKSHGSSSGLPPQNSPIKASRLEIKKGKMIMYSCSCLISEIESLVTVFRPISSKYEMGGFQRMLKKKRIEAIAKGYLKNNETFPNNVIIALEPKLYFDENNFWGQDGLKLYDEYNSLFIIDGQHRFFSLKASGKDRHVLITFVFYKDKTDKAILKMYETFYEINKKQEKVDASLGFILKAKIYKKSDEAFWFDVLKKLNDSSGFFKNKISFKEKQLRYKDEKNILSVIKYGGLLKLNNIVKKIEGLNYFYSDKTVEENKKFASNLLNNYFSIINKAMISIGKTKDDITPRDIGALIRLIRHFMINDKNILKTLGKHVNLNSVTTKSEKESVDRAKNIIKTINFIEVFSSAFSPSNWAAVEGLLLKHIHTEYPSFGNKKILSKKGLLGYSS